MRTLPLRLGLAAMAFVALAGPVAAHQCEGQGTWDASGIDTALEQTLAKLYQCSVVPSDSDDVGDLTACNRFVGRALEEGWKVSDFRNPSSPSQFMRANEIATALASRPQDFPYWVIIGNAQSQDSLFEAANKAQAGYPVIALQESANGSGHIALILPGGTIEGNSWDKAMVPRTANMALKTLDDGNVLAAPEKAFLGCGLNWAFGKPLRSKVNLYYRNRSL
jgi:hypothetical protein